MDEYITKILSFIALFTMLQHYLPPQLHDMLMLWYKSLNAYFNPPAYELDVPEFKDNSGVSSKDLYDSVQQYLASLEGIAVRQTAFRAKNSCSVCFSPANDEDVEDFFQGVRLRWKHTAESVQNDIYYERRSFTLILPKTDKRFLSDYINHITRRAEDFSRENKELALYTNTLEALYGEGWTGVPFKHSSTLATMALDPSLKDKILMDLDRFKQGKELYKRIGRSWKRGYLLYGPPGTGKSSLIAAIANHRKYDVYDLELTRVKNNMQLRALLTQTKEKSVIVIEDIDCSLQLTDRVSRASHTDEEDEKRSSNVTLSGMLNFTDGLWSCCGEERIIVFTTNHKDMLDPALLRSGRMDMKILLSFCTFPQFKSLASNYLQIDDHTLFPVVEEKIRSGAEMTPAEIIEILMNKMYHPDEALGDLISALDAKKSERDASLTSQSALCEGEGGSCCSLIFLSSMTRK
ncbi:hypothetical protein SUGI_0502570 [Cryptomeria japonica]|uniref:AAA-ATPase At5g57480 n=1 Tax=Cryptomeria japonica TaxID=3369 RepID=UPI002408C531|nr:AAA-ATPase At5g57480 [Cryptomeria japonica]GLJ26194.1 hypothetical protein SUGI_0502570 [Cryptomeria japonica]